MKDIFVAWVLIMVPIVLCEVLKSREEHVERSKPAWHHRRKEHH